MALGASVVLASAGGHREVPLDTMITGPGQTILKPDELLTTIRVPRPARLSSGCYEKMIRRQTLDVTIVGVAVQVALDRPGGTVTAARIFATSVAPVPMRLPETENCVTGNELTDEVLAAAADAAAREVKPIDDLRGAAWYRRHASGVLTRRALARAARRAGEPGGKSAREEQS
jgi:CO/xanthine dehydrogenase FAD-binding subunit